MKWQQIYMVFWKACIQVFEAQACLYFKESYGHLKCLNDLVYMPLKSGENKSAKLKCQQNNLHLKNAKFNGSKQFVVLQYMSPALTCSSLAPAQPCQYGSQGLYTELSTWAQTNQLPSVIKGQTRTVRTFDRLSKNASI